MNVDNTNDPEPSTSKQECPNEHSVYELYDKKVNRRPPKRKTRIETKIARSVSTVLTRLSSESTHRARSPGCRYCGHRCCRRRYEMELRRVAYKNNKLQTKKIKRVLRSECIQTGSHAAMLSPLFVTTNASLGSNVRLQVFTNYEEVTPEMIHTALEKLTKWRHGATAASITHHLLRTYPVNSDTNQLLAEVKNKLRIAVYVGIATQLSSDSWCLSTALEDRKLKRSHVTMFWEIYLNTMRPIIRKPAVVNGQSYEDSRTSNFSIAEDKIKRENDYF